MRLLSTSIPTDELDEMSGRCWLAGAQGIWEQARVVGVELRIAVADADVAAFRTRLGGVDLVDVTDRDSTELATQHVEIPFADRTLSLAVPGGVFGDGRHPTTRACLGAIEALVGPGSTVLDVGCGSGVLAIAAGALGASVTAVDLDSDAIATTRANAAANGVPTLAAATPLQAIEATYDVVVANLSAATIRAMAHHLTRRCGREGVLVCSGVLEDQWSEVAATLGGFVVESRVVEDGWTTTVLRRRGGPVRPAGS